MSRSPFLDKIVTAPHFPKPEGQVGYVSMETFPDLSHTGVRTKFEPKVEAITYSDGSLTENFKTNSSNSMSYIYREEENLNNKEEIFAKSHKQVITKILIEMELSKKEMLDRKNKYMNSSKNKLGFETDFGTLTRGNDSIEKKHINNSLKDRKKKVHYNR